MCAGGLWGGETHKHFIGGGYFCVPEGFGEEKHTNIAGADEYFCVPEGCEGLKHTNVAGAAGIFVCRRGCGEEKHTNVAGVDGYFCAAEGCEGLKHTNIAGAGEKGMQSLFAGHSEDGTKSRDVLKETLSFPEDIPVEVPCSFL